MTLNDYKDNFSNWKPVHGEYVINIINPSTSTNYHRTPCWPNVMATAIGADTDLNLQSQVPAQSTRKKIGCPQFCVLPQLLRGTAGAQHHRSEKH